MQSPDVPQADHAQPSTAEAFEITDSTREFVYDEKKLRDLVNILRTFATSLLEVYPEYGGEKLHPDVKSLLARGFQEVDKEGEDCTEVTEADAALYMHCVRVYPDRFMEIIYKDESVFATQLEKDGNGALEFLPGIDFREVWASDRATGETKASIWRYVQLVLFCLIESQSEKNIFENTSHVKGALENEDTRRKLAEAVKDLGSYVQERGSEPGVGGDSDASSDPDPEYGGAGDAPKLDSIHENLEKMFSGKIGLLAREIAQEALGGDEGDGKDDEKKGRTDEKAEGPTGNLKGIFDMLQGQDGDPSKMLEALMKNPGKVMGLVENIGSKLDSKLKSGELNEGELLEEASSLMSTMKNMPGMPNMTELFGMMSGKGGGRGRGGGKRKGGGNRRSENENSGGAEGERDRAHTGATVRDRLQRKLQIRDSEMDGLIESNMSQMKEIQDRLSNMKRG